MPFYSTCNDIVENNVSYTWDEDSNAGLSYLGTSTIALTTQSLHRLIIDDKGCVAVNVSNDTPLVHNLHVEGCMYATMYCNMPYDILPDGVVFRGNVGCTGSMYSLNETDVPPWSQEIFSNIKDSFSAQLTYTSNSVIELSNYVYSVPALGGGTGGSVVLNSNVNSTSTTTAATPSAVKQTYDLATDANTLSAATSNYVYPITAYTSNAATYASNNIVALVTSTTSTSTTTAATPSSVKTAYDLATVANSFAVFSSNATVSTSNYIYPLSSYTSNVATYASNNAIYKTGNTSLTGSYYTTDGIVGSRLGVVLSNGNNLSNQITFSSTIGSAHAIRSRHNTTANNTQNALDFFVWQTSDGVSTVGSKNVMSVTNTGVGVYSSNPQYPLHVEGNAYVNGYLTVTQDANVASDSNLKTDFEIIQNALDKVLALNGYTFTYRESTDNKRHAGLMAQEVRAVLPEVINQTMDGYLTVSYGSLAGLFVEAFKTVSERLTALESSKTT